MTSGGKRAARPARFSLLSGRTGWDATSPIAVGAPGPRPRAKVDPLQQQWGTSGGKTHVDELCGLARAARLYTTSITAQVGGGLA